MSITENIKKIRTAVLGKEVRSAIADSIEECYKDATTKDNANMEVSKARGNYNTLDDRLNSQDLKLSDKATAEALAVERARIDNLLKLQDGSTTGDAELADIRIKADGTIATSAGSAVREQVITVDNKISEVRELTESKNLFNTYFEDGSISTADGTLIDNKTTKYEHVMPLLAAVEESEEIKGLLILLNTVGGDVEAGLGIAELIAGMKKPTVSLVLGGGHSIGVPLAVAAKRSFIAPSAAMTIHPVRLNGVVIGVPQTYNYFARIQERIVGFVIGHSNVSRE